MTIGTTFQNRFAAPIVVPVERQAETRLMTRVVLAAMWAVLSLAAGQQWFGDSPDLPNYLLYYQTIGPFFDLANSRFEYGFQIVSWLWSSLGLGYESLFVVMAGVSLGCKFYLFERYLRSPILAAVSYILGFYLLHEYTQIRAAVGIGFALLGIHAMLQRRWWMFAVFTIAGILFHYSMIVMPLVALGARQIKGRVVIIAGALILVAGSTILPALQQLIVDVFSQFNPLTTAYVYNDLNADGANILSFASVMTVGIIVWMVAIPSTSGNKYTRVFFGMTLMSYLSLVLLRDSLELALRLRDALAVGIIFLVFREPISIRQIPPIILWFAAAAYLYYGYTTTQVLT